MRVDVAPLRLDVSLEDPAVLTVDIYNSSDIIEGFTVEVDGLPAGAWRAEPSSLSLFPDASGTIAVTITVPRGFPAGAHPLQVRVLTMADQAVAQNVEVTLDVRAFREARVGLSPESVTGGRRASFVATIDNEGNVPLRLQLLGDDQEGALRFEVADPIVTVDPANRVAVPVRVRGRRPLVGAPKPRMLSVSATEGTPDGVVTEDARATFLQKPWVPRSLLVVAAVLAPVAILAFVLTQAVESVIGASEEQEKQRATAEQAAREEEQAAIVNAPAGSISGRVEAADEPAANTVVELVVAASDPVDRGRSVGDVVGQTFSGPDGIYVLPDVTTPASYQVVFTHVGFAREAVDVELDIGESKSGIDAVLRPLDGTISGVVVDEDGPVGGATVTASDGLNQAEATTATEGDVGAFVLANLPTPGTYVVEATAAGTPPLATSIILEAGQQLTDVTLTLPTGVRVVSGMVRDPDGQPLPEVTVSAHAAPEPAGAAAPDAAEAAPAETGPLATTTTAATGAVGSYALQLAAPARYELRFELPGYVPVTRVVTLTAEEDAADVDAVLAPRAARLVGTVTIVERPGACATPPCAVTDVEVVASRGDEERATRTASEPAGVYVLEGLPPGVWTVRVVGNDRLAPKTVLVELRPGEQVTVDVVLEGTPGAIEVLPTGSSSIPGTSCESVEVALLDANGDPVPGHPPRTVDSGVTFAGLRTPDQYFVMIDDDPVSVVLAPGGQHTVEVACTPPSSSPLP